VPGRDSGWLGTSHPIAMSGVSKANSAFSVGIASDCGGCADATSLYQMQLSPIQGDGISDGTRITARCDHSITVPTRSVC
jgi:hypothetical protein